VGFGGGPYEKKWLSRGGHPKKIREKGRVMGNILVKL